MTDRRLQSLLKLYAYQLLDLSEQAEVEMDYLQDKLESMKRVLLAEEKEMQEPAEAR